MSTQKLTRLTLLLAIVVSLCQLGFAQLSEADFVYTDTYAASIDAPEELNLTATSEKIEPAELAFDFSKLATTPRFDTLEEYVAQHLVYPKFAESYGVEGSVVLSLKLSSTGRVIGATVEESLGYGCDEAALELVKQMPNWTPATNYGVQVPAKQRIAIDFTLR